MTFPFPFVRDLHFAGKHTLWAVLGNQEVMADKVYRRVASLP